MGGGDEAKKPTWAPGELRKRVAVLVGLVCGLAAPMWVWPQYCTAVLWVFLAGGCAEWWASAYGAGTAQARDAPWLLALCALWALPSAVMVARYDEVIGHRRLMEAVVIQLAVGDTAQLLCGRLLGRTYIFPRISPRKTLEGYIGGCLLTLAYGVAVHGWPAADVVLAFGAGCVGDLYFSAVKRRLGLKDFSRLLSAHGGLLDRIDSFVFAANALFWSRLGAGPGSP